MNDFLNKFKTYIQTRIETVQSYQMMVTLDSPKWNRNEGRLEAFEEILHEIDFLLIVNEIRSWKNEKGYKNETET